MSYSSKNNEIYYFLIANYSLKKEIGEYICEIGNNNNINFNIIKSTAIQILSSNNKMNEKKNKINFLEYNMYYKITNTNTFYLIVIKKNSKLINQENLIFELIDDIEHQGIRKLVDKTGELTNVGKQNLKFSIENYVESIQKKENNFFNYIFETNINKEKNNQNELINNEDEHNEKLIEKENKNSDNNLIEDNDDDNEEIINKSTNINDENDEFLQYTNSQNFFQYYNIKNKIIICCVVILVIIIAYIILIKLN